MLKEFRDFLMRGNLIELAVAVLIATALAALVKSLIDNIIMPVLAAFGGTPDFRDLTFTVNDSVFRYGAFLTDALTFIIIAAVIFFVIVRPYNAILARMRREGDDPDASDPQVVLLEDIKALLKEQNDRMKS
jgi:large conductance mechanosensitive channel